MLEHLDGCIPDDFIARLCPGERTGWHRRGLSAARRGGSWIGQLETNLPFRVSYESAALLSSTFKRNVDPGSNVLRFDATLPDSTQITCRYSSSPKSSIVLGVAAVLMMLGMLVPFWWLPSWSGLGPVSSNEAEAHRFLNNTVPNSNLAKFKFNSRTLALFTCFALPPPTFSLRKACAPCATKSRDPEALIRYEPRIGGGDWCSMRH